MSPRNVTRRTLRDAAVSMTLASVSALIMLVDLPRTASAGSLHYAPNHNFGPGGQYLPSQVGFNVADVNTVGQLDSLPPSVKGLVWVGQCDGVTSKFLQTVRPFIGHTKLFGFYLMDNPNPSGRLSTSGYLAACTAEHLRAESDWIHTNLPGAKTFMILMSLTSSQTPSFSAKYNPAAIHVDLFGIDPYPCRSELNGCDYGMIDHYVTTAEASGFPRSQMVPVYQAFGGGNYNDDGGGKYLLPTAAQESQILAYWSRLLPTPAFDFAYSWGSQEHDSALEGAVDLHAIFVAHNNSSAPMEMKQDR